MIDFSKIDVFSLPSCNFDRKSSLPDVRCVYFVISGCKVKYVGSTKSLKSRARNHHRLYEFEMLGAECRVTYFTIESDDAALRGAERSAIKYFNPEMNRKPVQRDPSNPEKSVPIRVPEELIPGIKDAIAAYRQGVSQIDVRDVRRQVLEKALEAIAS